MNRAKVYMILKYIIVIAIMTYCSVSAVLNMIDYVGSHKILDLVQSLIQMLVVILSIIELIILIRKSLYRRKFEHNDFQ